MESYETILAKIQQDQSEHDKELLKELNHQMPNQNFQTLDEYFSWVKNVIEKLGLFYSCEDIENIKSNKISKKIRKDNLTFEVIIQAELFYESNSSNNHINKSFVSFINIEDNKQTVRHLLCQSFEDEKNAMKHFKHLCDLAERNIDQLFLLIENSL